MNQKTNGKNCMEIFCKDLKDQAMKIINYEKKEMILSFMKCKKFVISVKKNFALIRMMKMNLKYTKKSEIIVIALKNLEELLIMFVI